jgi:hypothetical protein
MNIQAKDSVSIPYPVSCELFAVTARAVVHNSPIQSNVANYFYFHIFYLSYNIYYLQKKYYFNSIYVFSAKLIV